MIIVRSVRNITYAKILQIKKEEVVGTHNHQLEGHNYNDVMMTEYLLILINYIMIITSVSFFGASKPFGSLSPKDILFTMVLQCHYLCKNIS